jgi:hypothetical protein
VWIKPCASDLEFSRRSDAGHGRRASKDVVYTTSSRISSVRRPFGLALRTLSCAPPTFRRFDIAALGHFARNVVFSKNLSTRR